MVLDDECVAEAIRAKETADATLAQWIAETRAELERIASAHKQTKIAFKNTLDALQVKQVKERLAERAR